MRALHLIFKSGLLFFFSLYAYAETPEIQMFVNYRGISKYDLKIVSTPARPTSPFYIYVAPGETSTTAACYRGEPEAVFKLLREMVAIFNAEYHRGLRVRGTVVSNPETGLPALRLDGIEKGQVFNWFEYMRLCWRPANQAELHPIK